MGLYINKGNEAFQRIRNSEYVDKTGLISVVNSTLFTENCFTCVSRCRRFGKSMAAKMLGRTVCGCVCWGVYDGHPAYQEIQDTVGNE